MKKFYYFSFLLCFSISTLTFVACGDDDSDDPGTPTPTPTSNILLGKWYNSMTIPGGENPTVGKYYAKIVTEYEFKSDMSFVTQSSTYTIYEKADTAKQLSRSIGTYTYENDVLTVNCTKNEIYSWPIKEWIQQGEAWTVQYRVTTTENSITFTPTSGSGESITLTKGSAPTTDVKINNPIVGKWVWGEPEYQNVGRHASNYVFQSSGVCTNFSADYEYKEDVRTLVYSIDKTGTFKISGDSIFITWTNQKTFDISSGTVESKNPTADHVYVKYGDDAKTNMVLRRPIGNGRAGYSEEGPFTKVNN